MSIYKIVQHCKHMPCFTHSYKLLLYHYVGLIKAGSGSLLSDFSWLSGKPMMFTAWYVM